MPICLYDYIFLLLGEGKCVFIREEMDFGFERTLLILSLHYTINPNINVKLSEQKELLCVLRQREKPGFPFQDCGLRKRFLNNV